MPVVQFSERELEDFLCKDNNLKKYLGLRLLKRQYATPVGIIDILAYNPKTKTFVIIELKKDLLDTSAYHQIRRYYKYLSWKYTREYIRYRIEKVIDKLGKIQKKDILTYRRLEMLLIGTHLDTNLFYSVDYWHNDDDSDERNNIVHYRLFNVDFDKPISFDYHNINQRAIECGEVWND